MRQVMRWGDNRLGPGLHIQEFGGGLISAVKSAQGSRHSVSGSDDMTSNVLELLVMAVHAWIIVAVPNITPEYA